ncbi:sugar ABC transporter permease [Robertmurraya korlensis]|uniref:carbohydrate ABC transporter permease n=1 Tax=Robertmurraya korlensis TaxID=519977 RepID=UPI00203F5C39|nr:sugar ABC transporter permease [Robertmurraya korlensis]MCM3601152.1 sugar ABC transporter permease [Robertmurraya korlensis]
MKKLIKRIVKVRNTTEHLRQSEHYKTRDIVSAYGFLTPALILAILFIVLPIILAFTYGFTDYYLLKPNDKEFIGLENFNRMLTDEVLIQSFKNTLKFVVFVVPLQLSMALGLALIVNKKIRGVGFFRTAYFSPAVLSLVVISILWTVMLNPTSGLINELLTNVGISKQPFLSSASQAMYTIIGISAWSGCGYQMMIFLAGLKNIDGSLYEAADIDGANAFQKFLFITIPSLKPILMFLVITTTIQAFKLIVQPMVMTGGGPDYSTITILQYIYEYGFRHRNIGYASAITLVFTIFLVVISIIIKKLFREEKVA